MKTILKIIELSWITTVICLFISSYTFSQRTKSIWAYVENIESLKKSQSLKDLNERFSLSINKPLSNSRNEYLNKVYEFSCECDDVVELYAEAHKVKGMDKIQYGPRYETLNEPDDYSLYQNFNNNTFSSWHLDLIWAQAAWDVTHGTVPIAISDQNYFTNHEDLVGKILHYDNTNTSSQGHGTAVAVMAAGNTNNGENLASIGYDTNMGLYRMNYNDVLQAAYDGYKVINMSWTSGCDHNQFIEDALHEVYGLGVFMVAAGGNGTTCGGPTELVYPAAYDVVFAVSSVDHNDSHEQSNGNTHQHNSSIDLTAPGYDVPITAAPGWTLFASGTSYAAPIVSGTAGLMMSVYPGISPVEIKNILQSTAVNIDVQNPDYIGMLGAGRLMAGEAVKTALSHYYWSQNTTPIEPVIEPILDINYSTASISNNTTDDLDNASEEIYDMTGKKVNIKYAPNGIYLVFKNGVFYNKIWK